MKNLVLLVSCWSLVGAVRAAAADELPKSKIYHVDPKGLRIEGEIAAKDPRVRFKLNNDGQPLEFNLQSKMYDVALLPGRRYIISMDTVKPGLDSYLVLKDAHGNTLAFDDDSGGNLNARLVFDCPRKDTYRIHAAALSGTGRFILQVSESSIPKKVVNVVRQGFPAAQADPHDLTRSDTGWEIEWDITSADNGHGKSTTPSSVLAIRSAKFMFKDAAGKVRWFTVLKNLAVGEILVPYDRLEPVFLDVSAFAFHILPAKKEYLGPNCVLPGAILDSADPRMKNKVYREVHDDGLRWLNHHGQARRGEKLQLWAVFHGGNYRYLIEYGFRDDGAIVCRLGATAHNIFPRSKDQRDVHLHVACWHWDPEMSEAGEQPVGGPAANQVLLVRRLPRTPSPTGRFKVDITPFNANDSGQASEGFADWKPEEFTILRVQSLVRKNSSKNPQLTAYDLVPLRMGVVRNYPWKFDFANHDFWVTRREANHKKYHDVPMYATYGRPVDKVPMTIWHSSASLHVPRGEDYGPDGISNYAGAAVTTWAECLLKPVNLFDATPMYPAAPSGAKKK
jgi:hypothetical protein